jgi:transposase
MRGKDLQQSGIFSYVSPEERVPQEHPSRPVRRMADQTLKGLAARVDTLYAKTGRLSLAPEKPPRALLPQVLCSIRSEWMPMEQFDYSLLFRWFMGVITAAPWAVIIWGLWQLMGPLR